MIGIMNSQKVINTGSISKTSLLIYKNKMKFHLIVSVVIVENAED